MTRPQIFSIEGNIGSGKTTIIENLQKSFKNDPKVVFIREPVEIWQTIKDSDGETILAKFYRDPAKYAFSFQVMAYSTRLSMLRETIAKNPECTVIICERSLDADKHIFAKMLYDDGLIEDVNNQIYQRFYGEFQDEFRLDGIVYIDADADVCKERVAKRARVGEETVSIEYLRKCELYHEKWLSMNDLSARILRIKTNENVTYDMTCPSDKGTIWMSQIMSFVNEKNSAQMREPVNLEEFYYPTL
jgi:deoxyadenosine/deoxycytidine kinase